MESYDYRRLVNNTMSDCHRTIQKGADEILSRVWGKDAPRASHNSDSPFGYRIKELTQERLERVEADAEEIRKRLFP